MSEGEAAGFAPSRRAGGRKRVRHEKNPRAVICFDGVYKLILEEDNESKCLSKKMDSLNHDDEIIAGTVMTNIFLEAGTHDDIPHQAHLLATLLHASVTVNLSRLLCYNLTHILSSVQSVIFSYLFTDLLIAMQFSFDGILVVPDQMGLTGSWLTLVLGMLNLETFLRRLILFLLHLKLPRGVDREQLLAHGGETIIDRLRTPRWLLPKKSRRRLEEELYEGLGHVSVSDFLTQHDLSQLESFRDQEVAEELA
ncbi:uncharacterized protein A4U43_C08F17580 [Asparagus officinalis]|nr:uncharacterized protein A4U43_C08F17580 [Asparagus officinalis]